MGCAQSQAQALEASLRLEEETNGPKHIPAIHGSSGPLPAPESDRWVVGRTEKLSTMFELGEKLGEGTEGAIYIATETATGKKFACKAISTRVKRRKRANYFRRLRLELEILRKLNHPNICQFHHAFEDPGTLHIVLELCTGGELLDRIGITDQQADTTTTTTAQDNPTTTATTPKDTLAVPSSLFGEKDDQAPAGVPSLVKSVTSHGSVYSEKRAASFLRQIAEGIRYMHAHKIAHCDLKPENLLFADDTKGSRIKIVDFGLSRLVESNDEGLTGLRGTPFYVAPEVIEGSYSEACDMWSFGVITFLLLCGHPPFLANTTQEVYALITAGFKPVELPGMGPHFPAGVSLSPAAKDLISKLLVKDPLARISAEEALEHSWLTGVDASERPLGGIIRDIRNFTHHYKLKAAVLGVLKTELTEEDMRVLAATFHKLDANGDGVITLDEMRLAVEQENSSDVDDPTYIAVHKVEELFRIGDLNGDGQLQYDELVKLAVNRMLVNKQGRLKMAFEHVDKDGDGELSAEELLVVLKEAGEVADIETVRSLIAEADQNGDGVIDFEEFRDMWLRKETRSMEQRLSEYHAHSLSVRATTEGDKDKEQGQDGASQSTKSQARDQTPRPKDQPPTEAEEPPTEEAEDQTEETQSR